MAGEHDQECGGNWSARSDAEIASAWIDYEARPHSPAEEAGEDKAWWAVDAMMGLSADDPLRALEICFLIARSSDDPKVLEMLGAGPLEDLVSEDPTLVDAIFHESNSNNHLVTALKSMWQSTIPDHVWRELQRLIARQ
jgi:hypothetical protein